MSFWSNVLGFGKKAGKGVLDAVIAFVKSPQVKDLLATALGQIAKSVVSSMGNSAYATLSNEQKRKMAFDDITSQAKAQGISFTDSVVNLLIELALQSIKAHA